MHWQTIHMYNLSDQKYHMEFRHESVSMSRKTCFSSRMIFQKNVGGGFDQKIKCCLETTPMENYVLIFDRIKEKRNMHLIGKRKN